MYDKSHVTEELIESRYNIYTQTRISKKLFIILLCCKIGKYEKIIHGHQVDRQNYCANTDITCTDHDPTANIEDAENLQELIPNSESAVLRMQVIGHNGKSQKSLMRSKLILQKV